MKTKKFNFAPEIKVGSIFKRIDKNGGVWTAEVIERTEYYVKVKKNSPYKIKVANNDFSGCLGCWHYEETPETYETAKINEIFDYRTKETDRPSIWGGFEYETIKIKKNSYSIFIKEPYSKWNNYDKTYIFEF